MKKPHVVKAKNAVLTFTVTEQYKPTKEEFFGYLDKAFKSLRGQYRYDRPEPARVGYSGLKIELSTRFSVTRCTKEEYYAALTQLHQDIQRLMADWPFSPDLS